MKENHLFNFKIFAFKTAIIALAIMMSVTYIYPGFTHNKIDSSNVMIANSSNHFRISTAINYKFNNSQASNSAALKHVNPYELYHKEPAPMGIADFGIGPGGTPYQYNTTSFLGTINLTTLTTYNASLNSSRKDMTFQLNINYQFQDNGSMYVYWAQDVAYVNTSTDYLCFIDNVWNMSSKNAGMNNSTISGSGSIEKSGSTHFYYAVYKHPMLLSSSHSVDLLINSTTSSKGFPELNFMFNNGNVWVTFDSPIFLFATNIKGKPVFEVNGNNYEPNGYTFYNAELIMGGPGGGTQTKALISNVILKLKYWNGNNYQYISNAYNFGSNTAEGICQVTSSEYTNYGVNMALGTSVINGSGGTLGQVYNSANLSFLKILTPFQSGTLIINASVYHFVNYEIYLTLPYNRGIFPIILDNGSSRVYETNISIGKGSTVSLKLYKVSFNAVFQPNIIPSNFTWEIKIDNQVFNSSKQAIEIALSNGTYNYMIYTNIQNLKISTPQGNLTISGLPKNLKILLSRSSYKVVFNEQNIPIGFQWTIQLTNITNISSTTPSAINANLPNGTYSYSASSTDNYAPVSNGTGKITVQGSNITVLIVFGSVNNTLSGNYLIFSIALPIVILVSILSVALYYKRKNNKN
ncbi:MAG: thermopsin [Thermoplasmataceae archaeon]